MPTLGHLLTFPQWVKGGIWKGIREEKKAHGSRLRQFNKLRKKRKRNK